MTIRVGTIGWSYSFWKPNFYPQKVASKDFLKYYSSKFGTVEVDNTFYRIPTAKAVTDWKNQTSKGFVFSLKFPQRITHVKMLKDCQEETQLFLERASLLGEKLGVLLLQFPPFFRQQHFSLLSDYLKSLPSGYRYAVEVRNKSLLNRSLYQLLQECGVALAWAENPKMPLTLEATADFVYVRLEGDRKTVQGLLGKVEVDRTAATTEWANRIKPYLATGRLVFVYFGKFYSGFPPSDVQELLKQLNA